MPDKSFHELVRDMRRVRLDELAQAAAPTFERAREDRKKEVTEEVRSWNAYHYRHYVATGQPAEREDGGWI